VIIMTKPPYISNFQFMMLPNSPMRTYLWNDWGIRPQVDIVYDPSSSVGDWYAVEPANASTSSNIPHSDTGMIQPLFKIANSWEIDKNPRPNVVITPIYSSSDKSYGKTNIQRIAATTNSGQLSPEPGDLTGPLVLVATGENAQSGGKVVLIGDSLW